MEKITDLDGVSTWYAAQRARRPAGGGAADGDDPADVQTRTLVVSGDDDAVSLEHTPALHRGLPDAEPAVVPGTSHVLIEDRPDLVADLVLGFLTTEPVPTLIPIRRR